MLVAKIVSFVMLMGLGNATKGGALKDLAGIRLR